MEVVVHPEEVTEAIHRAELELEHVRQSYGYRWAHGGQGALGALEEAHEGYMVISGSRATGP